jgi:alkylation response protein AidB-like acyl-CoA dehydrogenase
MDADGLSAILSSQQRDLAAALRGLLSAECPSTLARALAEPGADRTTPSLWKALADVGVFGLAIAEEHGGSGGSLDDLAVTSRQGVGCAPRRCRAPSKPPWRSTSSAAQTCARRGCRGWRGGEARGTTALWSARDAADVSAVLHAEPHPSGGWLLNGTADFVADVDVADLIVVSAADAARGRTLVFIIDSNAAGVSTEPLALMGGQRAFEVRFEDVAVTADDAVLGGDDRAGVAEPALRRLANTAIALGSLDLVGIGQAVPDRTVDYTKLRHQFGRPIASFQAAQHLIANMHIALAAARLAAHSAVFWIGRGRTATRETAIARTHAATAAKLITLDAHQLHGGMGYVTETDLHLWSERARVLSTLGGGADVAASWLEGATGE